MFPSLRDEIACCTNPFAGKGGKVSGIIRLATGPCFLNALQNITVHRHKISGGDLKMLTFSMTFWRVTPSYFLAGYHYISTAPWLCLCPLITNSACHSRRSLTSSLATFFKVMSPLLCLNKLNRILKAVWRWSHRWTGCTEEITINPLLSEGAVGGDERRQSRRSIGSGGVEGGGRDCKKATTKCRETSAALEWTHNIYATALIAVKFISLF